MARAMGMRARGKQAILSAFAEAWCQQSVHQLLLATGDFGTGEFELRLSNELAVSHCPPKANGGGLLGFANIR
jgi:hypothetical protein